MSMISPILQNKLNSQTSLKQHHEKAYQDLQKRANEVKPNEAKARLVKEGMLGNPITATLDVAKDCKNFVTATGTGQMSDNNLGRINDLGLKVGAGLIATFLALHSKTKTESLMRFIGGATFIGAMSLWPKLFINIPARLVHGFRIDRKYISAQGDKKDLGLDNQFYVWDAYPEEQLRKDAKRAGIDYDAPNGKEKIQRKIQKTTLQNRTLWMATAGFATPLITAMVCNFIEPEVQKAVVKSSVKKAGENISDIERYMRNCTPQVEKQGDIKNALDEVGKTRDFTELAQMLTPNDFAKTFKDVDDLKPIEGYNSSGLAKELGKIYDKLTTIKTADLDFSGVQTKNETLKKLGGGKSGTIGANKPKLSIEEIKQALGESCSLEKAKDILKQNGISEDILAGVKTDESRFKGFIKEFNEGPVALLRSRIKAYMDILNPIIGSKAESAYTLEINKTFEKMFKTLGLDKNLGDLRRDLKDDSIATVSEAVKKAVQNSLQQGDDGYKKLIQDLSAGKVNDNIQEMVERLKDTSNIKNLAADFETTYEGVDMKALTRALLGGDESQGIINLIKAFIGEKEADIGAIKTKAVICANFERRLLKGGDLNYLTLDENKNLLAIARKIIYDGAVATAENKGDAFNPKDTDAIVSRIFNPKQFKLEDELLPNINLKEEGGIIENLAKFFRKESTSLTPTEKYLSCGSFTQHIKNLASRIGNNKAWLKIFAPMAIILVAVTLLIQPMFGKIDKEFPDETKAGGRK